jgi:hypothetical protein
MDRIVNRRSALSIGGHVAAAAAATAIVPASLSAGEPHNGSASAMVSSLKLTETAPSFSALFPSTRYFEIDSDIAGARFSAWVTPPAQYDADKTQAYPVVYQVDGNLFFPATVPFHQAGQNDPLSPQIPFILVSIGYSTPESKEWVWLRVRDLLPPNEPIPDVMRQAVELGVKAGSVSRDDGNRYLAMFDKPAGDKFLAFIEQELHPQLAKTFRIDESNVGLWGDSYGGLFAAYVAIKRSNLIKTVGAGSPGIVGAESQIFELYRQALSSKRDYSGRKLHVTIGARELTQPSIYQWLTGRAASDLLAQTSLHPLPGLQVSAEVIPLETHLTGGVPAWFSFLRACYGRNQQAKS